MIKAILFDLDGTLLPMRQDEFTTAYFESLSKKLAWYGYEPHRLIGGIWQGTKAMVKNDGKQTNEQVFWKEFAVLFGDKVYDDIDKFNAFYENDFDSLKSYCGYNEQANNTVQTLKKKGYTLVLASNPVFPIVAQKKRMQWAGVNPDDFALITAYENSCYCKPNPLYFKEIAEKIGVEPSECLMVGNDTTEDAAAKLMGVDFFLLTNCLLNKERKDISKYPRGNFTQLLDYIENLS
ncbi:MAG: HAD family hydrolase [Clostridiales bacterium]|nr:HAD family hydrolase [Clostridiales bacterium]